MPISQLMSALTDGCEVIETSTWEQRGTTCPGTTVSMYRPGWSLKE